MCVLTFVGLRHLKAAATPPRRCACSVVPKCSHAACCCSRRAPSGTFRSANMSIEAHVMRLSCRQGPATCFFPSCASTASDTGELGAKVLLRSSYCWWRAPSCTCRSADMSPEAHVMRLPRRQCRAACFWRLLRQKTSKWGVVCKGRLRGPCGWCSCSIWYLSL